MKFDYCIGNPPYQEEAETVSETNGQRPRKNIFHYFQIEADKITNEGTVLVYPGVRWLHQSGKGLKQFGAEQINDPKLKKVCFYTHSDDLFKNTDIPDGITIVVKNEKKKTPGFEYSLYDDGVQETITMKNPGSELIALNPKDSIILDKINAFVKSQNLAYLHDSILPRSLFSIESDFVEKHPNEVKELRSGVELNNNEIKLFTNDKAGAAGRGKWFIVDESLITHNKKMIYEYQVVVSSAHPGGQDGRDNQLAIIDNRSAFGRTRVALKSFLTLEEAQNFYNYMNSYLIKYALLMTDEALSSVAKKVPDLKDYTSNNPYIDYGKNIDNQIIQMWGLSSSEIEYIKNIVSQKKEVE